MDLATEESVDASQMFNIPVLSNSRVFKITRTNNQYFEIGFVTTM